MTSERRGYLAYMLRLWRVDTEEGTVWRASVESPHTGERRGFVVARIDARHGLWLCILLGKVSAHAPLAELGEPGK